MSPVKPTKKYICSFCARPFSRSEHKLRHERSHTNTKPFACTICNASFVRRDLMQRHLRNVHKIDNTTAKATAAAAAVTTTATVIGGDSFNPNDASSPQDCSVPSPPESRRPSVVNTSQDNLDITQLLTLSKSHQKLQLPLCSHIPTLFFIYATSNIPIDIDDSNIHAALCYSASFVNLHDCFKLFNRALSQPNLKSLSILAWTYLMRYDSLHKNLIPIDVILTQLDTLLVSHPNEVTFDCWFVYNIQAQYVLKFNKQPPLSHSSFFLNKEIEGTTLTNWLKILSKSSNHLPSPENLSNLLNCLIMELQNLKFNSNHKLDKTETHNAIIMFNKFYISKLIQLGNTSNESTISSNVNNSQFSKIFMISKRHVLLNVPQSFQDLIIDYVLIPYDSNHVNLLHLTLREFQYWNSIKPLKSTCTELDFKSMLHWIDNLNITTINNNLGLISYPLIFLGSLPLSLSEFKKNNNEFKGFVLEVFLILIKVFIEGRKIDDFENNVVLKGVVYLLFEISNESRDGQQIDLSDPDSNASVIDALFDVLKKWMNYYQFDVDQDLDSLKTHLLTPKSMSIGNTEASSPNLSAPLYSKHSPISDSSSSEKLTSLPTIDMSTSNYSYFPQNQEARIKLPPLSNLPALNGQSTDNSRLRFVPVKNYIMEY